MTGLDIVSDFFISFLIRSEQGYSHILLTQLTFLYGEAAPRLDALCAGFKDQRVFATTSASFVLCKLILQCFGSRYFGVTAIRGTQREFYFVHRLHPFLHGRAAYRMYVGALLWLAVIAFFFPILDV